MKYAIVFTVLLFSVSSIQAGNSYIMSDLKQRCDTKKEKVLAYFEDGQVIELSEGGTAKLSSFNIDTFSQLCRTKKRFLLVHSHVVERNSSLFPSPLHERDGKITGDFNTIFALEYYCENLAVQENIQRAEITHALYDVSKDVFVAYDLGEAVKKGIRDRVNKSKEYYFFNKQYCSTESAFAVSETIRQAHVKNKRAELLKILNDVYGKAYNTYFSAHCGAPSGEVTDSGCPNVDIWEFAEQTAHLNEYFTITPCPKGELCMSF